MRPPPPPDPLARELTYLAALARDGRLADYLAAWGERGEPDVGCDCVLARHLRRRLGVAVEISYGRTGDPLRLEVLDEHASPLAVVPADLVTFVAAFDAGHFPDLVLVPETPDGDARTPPPVPGPADGRPHPPAGG